MILDGEDNKKYIRLLVLKNTFVPSHPDLPCKKERKILQSISKADLGRDILKKNLNLSKNVECQERI